MITKLPDQLAEQRSRQDVQTIVFGCCYGGTPLLVAADDLPGYFFGVRIILFLTLIVMVVVLAASASGAFAL